MLNKNEKAVMEFLYKKSQGSSCLTSYQEIIVSLSHKIKLSEAKLKEIISSLEQDDYLDVINSDRHGEPLICVTMHLKGKAFPREMVQSGRVISPLSVTADSLILNLPLTTELQFIPKITRP